MSCSLVHGVCVCVFAAGVYGYICVYVVYKPVVVACS